MNYTVIGRTKLLTPGSHWKGRGKGRKVSTIVKIEGVWVTYVTEGKMKRAEADSFLLGHRMIGEPAFAPGGTP